MVFSLGRKKAMEKCVPARLRLTQIVRNLFQNVFSLSFCLHICLIRVILSIDTWKCIKNAAEIQTHPFHAVIMLVYCRYGVKHYLINHSFSSWYCAPRESTLRNIRCCGQFKQEASWRCRTERCHEVWGSRRCEKPREATGGLIHPVKSTFRLWHSYKYCFVQSTNIW